MSVKAFAGIPLRCSKCGLPYARVQNGVLIIESKHRGETHVNVIALADLAELAGIVKHDDESDS
jgi:hypothetical protein